MEDKTLVLSWKYHNATISNVISKFREKGNYSDVTLSCEGRFYPAHRLVLAACSEYFEDMFHHTPCKHLVIVLRDITAKNLEALLNYMYAGVANIAQNDLANLIKAAESLRIKGLAVPDDSHSESADESLCQNTTLQKPRKRRKEDDITSTPRIGSSTDHASTSPNASESQSLEDLMCDPVPVDSSEREDRANSDASHISNTIISPCTSDIPYKDVFMETSVKQEVTDSTNGILDIPYGGDNSYLENSNSTSVINEHSQNFKCQPIDYLNKFDGTSLDTRSLQQISPRTSHHQLDNANPLNSSQPSTIHGNISVGTDDGNYTYLGFDGFSCENQPDSNNQLHQQVHLPMDVVGRMEDPGCRPPRAVPSLPVNRKIHHCSHCSYSTPWHSVFVRHCRIHSGEKPFTCSYCSFRSSRKSVIKRHCLTLHSTLI